MLLLAPFLAVLLAAADGPARYVIVPEESTVTLRVGKAGLFKFAGHSHEVTAPARGGEIAADAADLARSSVSVTFAAADLRVTGKDEPPEDQPKVQEAMLGPKVLDAGRYPDIAFRSQQVSGRETSPGVFELQVRGELTLHGVSRPLTLPVHVERAGTLVASGRTSIRQTDYGIKPVSVAGVVNVRNEVEVEFRFTARASP
jgi:polyisoprenoid-binding protein YceI